MSATIAERALKCIRCGFCLDACPTFRLTGNEADSPRGRIYLMRSVAEGELEADSSVVTHIDRCLGCRACETACPSGVEYGSILEGFRAEMEREVERPIGQKFARKQFVDLLSSPSRLAFSLKAGRLLGAVSGLDGNMPGFASSLLNGRPDLPVRMPHVQGPVSVGRLPALACAEGEKKRTVAMLAGCVMRVLFHPTNLATVRVLQRAGCDVLCPETAGCCGAFHAHAGYEEDARNRARALIDTMARHDFEAFIVNSAGCGSALKAYGDLLADDPDYAATARSFAGKVKDVSEYLEEIGAETPGRFEGTVAYHDACHLAHGQQITAAPRKVLGRIEGLTLIDLPESDTCCGSAGTYNVLQPELARRLLERKVEHILHTGATVVATGNPGCLAWIRQGLEERGAAVRIMHPVEILDEAASGSPAS